MFWAEIWKISEFLSEIFQFLEVKFSIYLNRRVFVMDLSLHLAHMSEGTSGGTVHKVTHKVMQVCIMHNGCNILHRQCKHLFKPLRLNKLSYTFYWKSPFSILGMSGYTYRYSKRKLVELFSNSGDPDQTPRSAASDLGLHCLLVTRLGVSSLQWLNDSFIQHMIVLHIYFWWIINCQLILVNNLLSVNPGE